MKIQELDWNSDRMDFVQWNGFLGDPTRFESLLQKIPSNVTFVQFQYDKLQPGIDFHFARVGMESRFN